MDCTKINILTRSFDIFEINEKINNCDFITADKINRIKDEKKTQIIENLLLRIPLFCFYSYIDKSSGVNYIITGNDILLTINEFISDKFVLKDCVYLKDCNNKKYSELEKIYQRRLHETHITLYIVDMLECKEMHDVLKRLCNLSQFSN